MKIADSYIRWNTPMWIDIPNHRNKDAFSLKGETGKLLYLGIVPEGHCAEMTEKRLFKRISTT